MSSNESDHETVLSMEDVDVHFNNEQGLLDRFFPQSDTVRAVNDFSLEIPENDIVALVGESGCGKTTAGKTAIGLQEPTAGAVKYRGQDIWEARDRKSDPDIPYSEIRRSLQIIHQDPGSALNPNRTILRSLATPLKKWYPDLDSADRRARILNMLERVRMTPAEDYARRYPHQLSGGEQQRVALVRALLMNPDLILADEAVSALDVSLRIEMMDLMLDLQEEFDTSFLFISHNLSNAKYFAEGADGRLGVMYLGELVELGPVNEVLENPKHPYTKVLKWATPNLNPAKQSSEAPPVRKIDIPDPSQELSGCPYHTRCPEAREICQNQQPDFVAGDDEHYAACYRQFDDHEYWESPVLEDEESFAAGSGDRSSARSDD